MRFYETEFSQLRAATVMRPAAADLVSTAIDQGCAVVVATNPLFPRTAIEQRLDWAGVPDDAEAPEPELLDRRGTLEQLARLVRDGYLEKTAPGRSR